MKLIIVSNRLPVTVQEGLPGQDFKRSIGGLVTGIESYVEKIRTGETEFDDFLWVGWPGTEVPEEKQATLTEELIRQYRYCPVFLKEDLIQGFYFEFCNKTLWPLFHYFPNQVNHDNQSWLRYVEANTIFYEALNKQIQPGDVVWIHDYHLMLLPALIREDFPDATINFFLHIPFPTYDIFRNLARAEQTGILNGLLGADVIGFHTYGYAQDFLKAVYKILKLKDDNNLLLSGGRKIKVDIFPMGVDYTGISALSQSDKCQQMKQEVLNDFAGHKLILSIDRLDYTKGILNRLIAFSQFLTLYPEWRGKLVLMLIVAPSRREIDSYQQMKKSIDEWVGNINGTFSNGHWIPVIYQYRQMNLLELCALYSASDIALITPLRDGMNLIAKEYIAARTDKRGVLILSEMAGAINEFCDAIAVNPYNIEEIVLGMQRALYMPEAEQISRNTRMRSRLESYDVVKWAQDNIGTARTVRKGATGAGACLLDDRAEMVILDAFKRSGSSLFFFDYDGTLSPLAGQPEFAVPDTKMLDMLKKISNVKGAKVVIVSGRDRNTLSEWFKGVDVSFGADLGAWINTDGNWEMLRDFDRTWKQSIKPILAKYSYKLPYSYIEEKECALVWDYRRSDPELSNLRAVELTEELYFNAELLEQVNIHHGENGLIVQNKGSNKGNAASFWLEKKDYDFILAIGDDDADEELFKALPEQAVTLRVGKNETSAKFYTPEQKDVTRFLGKLTNVCK